MDIRLELRKVITEPYASTFYRYNINGNLVWFDQDQREGNIYAVYIRLNEDFGINKYFDVWIHCEDNRLFYPDDITIEIKSSRIKQEDVGRIVSDINYISRLCDKVMSIFRMEEHYDLWYKHHKDIETNRHKPHHCVCCGKYIEEEHLKVCDKCASEFKI